METRVMILGITSVAALGSLILFKKQPLPLPPPPAAAAAPPNDTISLVQRQAIGSWILESFQIRTHDATTGVEEIDYPLGQTPSGLLTYTSDGHVMVNLMKPGCPRFEHWYFSASDPELVHAGRHFLAYSGTYSMEMKEGQLLVSHHISVSNFPNFLGETVVRALELSGDTLTLAPRDVSEWMEEQGDAILQWRRATGK